MEKAPTFLSNWQPGGGEINGCRIQCIIQSDDTQMIF